MCIHYVDKTVVYMTYEHIFIFVSSQYIQFRVGTSNFLFFLDIYFFLENHEL